jgi:ABC-type bacteriocin/lantibiotic exporter with double-glycine peptidase domain
MMRSLSVLFIVVGVVSCLSASDDTSQWSYGASSIYTVLRWLNVECELAALKIMLPESFDASANDLVHSFAVNGVRARVYKCTTEDLLSVPAPFIVHIRVEEPKKVQFHFMPVVRVNKDRRTLTVVDVNLSKSGPIDIPIDAFVGVFTGYFIKPGNNR